MEMSHRRKGSAIQLTKTSRWEGKEKVDVAGHLPSPLFVSTIPSLSPSLHHFYCILSTLTSPISFTSLKPWHGHIVWSYYCLMSPNRNQACCCSAACHCDICIEQERMNVPVSAGVKSDRKLSLSGVGRSL